MKAAARTFANISARSQAPKVDLEEQQMNAVFARIAATPDGQVQIAFLRQITKEMTLPSTASDSALRELEGQRQLVARIERMISSGERAKS